MKKKTAENTCYLLLNSNGRKSYRGFTNNMSRRLRQHKRLICGGAKYTKTFDQCYLLCYISGFTSQSQAMSYEWYTKKNRCRCNYDSSSLLSCKVERFLAPLLLPKFQLRSCNLKVYINPKYTIENINSIIQKYNISISNLSTIFMV